MIRSPQAIPPCTWEIFAPHLCRSHANINFLCCRNKGLTWNLGKLSKPGKSSMSPVLMLKQAPCQGQRTLPLDKTPA